jgi:hypothetical protein
MAVGIAEVETLCASIHTVGDLEWIRDKFGSGLPKSLSELLDAIDQEAEVMTSNCVRRGGTQRALRLFVLDELENVIVSRNSEQCDLYSRTWEACELSDVGGVTRLSHANIHSEYVAIERN